jgi:ankyrin repeat protein
MLIAQTPSLAEIAEQALAAPISNSDVASARLLLEAGANPNRYRIDAGHPTSVLWAALEAGCEGEFLELLLDHRADPNAAASEGRTTASLRQHVASRPAIIRLREQLAAARVRRVFAAAFVALGARLAVTARS